VDGQKGFILQKTKERLRIKKPWNWPGHGMGPWPFESIFVEVPLRLPYPTS